MPRLDLTSAHKEIGEKLKALREATGKSIKQAAAEAGINPGALSRIEDGKAEYGDPRKQGR